LLHCDDETINHAFHRYPMTTQPALIALDWGTTSLRAYLVDAQAAVIDSLSTSRGILNVPGGDFDAVFTTVTGRWLEQYGALPAIAAGMIGSRQGWREAPYIPCPAGAAAIAGQLTAVTTGSGSTLWLVPGVSYADASGVPDVMRGEETQIIGELVMGERAANAASRQLFVLPGTHSKWVQVQRGHISWFATFMSGEVFAVLRDHSILGRLMDGRDENAAAFRRGLDYAAVTDPTQGGLLKRLFSARTLGLFGQLAGTELSAYLSGLIIGSEIGEGLACLGHAGADDSAPISVIGGSVLSRLYVEALTHRGVRCAAGSAEAVVTGLFKIAQDAGLLEKNHEV
jgi:2-dehydro-3-deoxygalactonokinase